MDTCPRCRSADPVERAHAIVGRGMRPLSGLLCLPAPPPMPGQIKAYRACIGAGVFLFIAGLGSTSDSENQQDAVAVQVAAAMSTLGLLVLIVGLILLASSGEVRRQWRTAGWVYQTVRRLWPLLDYCHYCNLVFMAGGTFGVDPVHTVRFLWEAADHTLKVRAPRPPGM
ncbi:hypothetical protein [Actinomadura litoris]|uniref:hypothetical protein n=1 Tax=Actinomadura litoris TaxID=2678616 RepID=UPI001FA6AAD4|nr:hypothetical protein [Actinomadura litoris]